MSCAIFRRVCINMFVPLISIAPCITPACGHCYCCDCCFIQLKCLLLTNNNPINRIGKPTMDDDDTSARKFVYTVVCTAIDVTTIYWIVNSYIYIAFFFFCLSLRQTAKNFTFFLTGFFFAQRTTSVFWSGNTKDNYAHDRQEQKQS